MEQDTEILNKIALKGVMKRSELEKIMPYKNKIQIFIEKGFIYPIGIGIFAHQSIDPFVAAVFAVSKYFSKAVISNRTALFIHELSDERIDKIDVDIPRETSIKNKLISPHRVSNSCLTGIIHYELNGRKIKIYSPERSLCDAYRIDRNGHIFIKALKKYINKGLVDTKTILKLDSILKTDVLSALTQEMADG